MTDGDLRCYGASRIPEIDFPKLTHFAMGVFWKASAHSWRGGETTPLIELGKYGELLRVFLSGEAPFPEKMALVVGVIPPAVKTINFCYPYRGSACGYHNYLFHILSSLCSSAIRFLPSKRRTVSRHILCTA